MKIRWGWLAAGIAAFIIFLIAYLPAAQIIGRITLPKGVVINGVSGTVWSGKINQLGVNGLPVNQLTWDVHPWSLFTGKLSVTLKAGNIRNADDIAFSGPVQVSLFNPEHVAAQKFSLYLPTNRVIAQVPLPLPVDAGGRFRVQITELDFAKRCAALNATGDWLNASVAGTQGPIELGTFSADLACQGDDIAILVAEPNSFGLNINAIVSANFKDISVTGKFKPDDSLPDEVHQAARFFGQPGADGYIPVKL